MLGSEAAETRKNDKTGYGIRFFEMHNEFFWFVSLKKRKQFTLDQLDAKIEEKETSPIIIMHLITKVFDND